MISRFLPPPSRITLPALFLLGVFLAGMTGCVSQDQHKRLQTAFDQSRAQLAEAENDLNAARARNTELEAKIAELNKLVGLGGNDALRRERDLLAQQLADMQKKYNDLLAMGAGKPPCPKASMTPSASSSINIPTSLSLMNASAWCVSSRTSPSTSDPRK